MLFPDGLCLFRAFLVSEFSEENVAFYLACEDYKETKPSKQAAKARDIYEEFVRSDAPREVIITHSASLQEARPPGGCDPSPLLHR